MRPLEGSASPASSWPGQRGRRWWPPCATPTSRDAVGGFGATAIAPDDFGDHGPFDVVLELVGAPNVPDDLRALASGGRIAVIGIGGGRGPR